MQTLSLCHVPGCSPSSPLCPNALMWVYFCPNTTVSLEKDSSRSGARGEVETNIGKDELLIRSVQPNYQPFMVIHLAMIGWSCQCLLSWMMEMIMVCYLSADNLTCLNAERRHWTSLQIPRRSSFNDDFLSNSEKVTAQCQCALKFALALNDCQFRWPSLQICTQLTISG